MMNTASPGHSLGTEKNSFMTDDQFRELKTLVLGLRAEIEALRLHIAEREKIEDERWRLIVNALYEDIDGIVEGITDIDVPEDLKRFLPR